MISVGNIIVNFRVISSNWNTYVAAIICSVQLNLFEAEFQSACFCRASRPLVRRRKFLQLLIVLVVVMVFLLHKHKDHALQFLLSFMNFEALIFAEARAMPKFRKISRVSALEAICSRLVLAVALPASALGVSTVADGIRALGPRRSIRDLPSVSPSSPFEPVPMCRQHDVVVCGR